MFEHAFIMQCNSQNCSRSCLRKHGWKISRNVPTQLLKPSSPVARAMLSHKDKISSPLNISKERLQSGFGLLRHERKYASLRRMGANCFFLKTFLPVPEESLHLALLDLHITSERRPEILPPYF